MVRYSVIKIPMTDQGITYPSVMLQEEFTWVEIQSLRISTQVTMVSRNYTK